MMARAVSVKGRTLRIATMARACLSNTACGRRWVSTTGVQGAAGVFRSVGDKGTMDLSRFDVVRFLANLPLFQALQPGELQRLAEGCELFEFERGHDLFRVGQPCQAFHVVVCGKVKLYAIAPSGQEKTIEIISPGGTFGEALMFMEQPYIVNVQALSDGVLLGVKRHAVQREIVQDPLFAMRMLAGLSRRLHGLVRDVQAYALHSGVQRVIGYLMRDVPSTQGAGQQLCVQLSVTKATIASRLSMTPEYFSRVLRELEDAGLIEVDKRCIRILDMRRLAEYSASA